MSIGKKAKRAAAAGVALATGSLSSCGEEIAVDPPPPPLACNTVDQGQSLAVTAERVERALTVRVRQSPTQDGQWFAQWKSVEVIDPDGVTVANIVTSPDGVYGELLITLLLGSDTTTTASFKLRGVVFGYNGVECAVTRTFTITVDGQNVIVARREMPSHGLPLASREPAAIVVTGKSDGKIEFRAHTNYRGIHEARWSVTGGSMTPEVGDSASWQPPAEAGLYQVRLVVDYGPDGLAVDNATFEVTQE
jgi:hypothetical protein